MDKAYHRLLTSDNVSKFRPEIVERLESKSRSRIYIEKASMEIAGIKEISKEEAEELVYHYIRQIIDAFQNMDDILVEINRKNTQYQRAAVNRAKFLLTGSEDIRGQLKELLMGINERMNEESLELGGIYRIDFLDELVRIYSVAVMDEKSLYAPIEGRKEFRPSQLDVEEPDLGLRQEKLRKMMEKMQRVMNPDKINHYVREHMGDLEELQASGLPMENKEDFVKLIYVRLYGQRKNMEYTVEPGEETESGGYRFRDFTIRRNRPETRQ